MKRVNSILKDEEFKKYVSRNAESEQDRIFCHHDRNHFLDVCRIGWILNLEGNLGIDKEIIYASGLLHDIGRWAEYATGEDHAAVGGKLADGILTRCGFSNEERTSIVEAIACHRKKEHPSDLSRILYRADKLSRACFDCKASDKCKKFKDGDGSLLF